MKRPWNMVDLPVYSLATYENDKVNMNICAYVSAISMNPKLYAIALYEGTKTLENALVSDTFILQLLSVEHAALMRTLGKQSGKVFDKDSYLRKKQLLKDWKGKQILNGCAALLYLEKKGL